LVDPKSGELRPAPAQIDNEAPRPAATGFGRKGL
jgi:hypothetical protein